MPKRPLPSSSGLRPSGTQSGRSANPDPAAGAHHRRLESLEEFVDGGHVMGSGDQALHQPLPGQPVLDLIVEDQSQGPGDGSVGNRIDGTRRCRS